MSIGLASNAIESHLIGGVAVETNASAALIGMSVDYNAGMMTWTFTTGTVTNGSITPGAHSTLKTVTLNLSTGTWQSIQDGTTGTVQAAGLSLLVSSLKNARNGIEQAAIVQGIYSGTPVVWT